RTDTSTRLGTLRMVNYPKKKTMYCPDARCKAHKSFKVVQYKAGKARLCARQTALRPQTVRLWRSDEAHFPQEGQDDKEDCPEAPMLQLQVHHSKRAQAHEAL
ncbi:60S ribosomal protein L44, partial [Trypanosoma cruzi]